MGRHRLALAIVMALVGTWAPAVAQISVTTYHNDTSRTGWNPRQTLLSAGSVGGGQFHLQSSVMLDEQVERQPLVIANQTIAGKGTHTVVYVATDNNTVYAIDGASGAILLSRNLGRPVPQSALPGQCNNNGPNIGVDSTPVISTSADRLYVVTDTYENNAPIFRLHALNLSTLQDSVAPTVVSATHRLTNGAIYNFNAQASRQRAALLLSGGTVYAAFSSYCDMDGNASRGWLLGWNAKTLAPLANAQLENQVASAPDDVFLTSIWMSGYGPATFADGYPIFFTTGNASFSGGTYKATANLAESLVKVSPDLSQIQGYFTPSNESTLDQDDNDFGAEGAMLASPGSGLTPKLVMAAGKNGLMYLLNRSNPNAGPLGTYAIGGCWCGPSSFTGADGVGRIVTSGGTSVQTWKLNVPAAKPASLTADYQTSITTGQDPGFHTSVSSNQTQSGSAVIWAVSRPTDANPADVTLYAIDPASRHVIHAEVAGTWPNTGGDANIVPTVANGHVYVATNRELAIFGLGGGKPASQALQASRTNAREAAGNSLVLSHDQHAFFGRVQRVQGAVLTIRTRDGASALVDVTGALRNSELDAPVPGRAVLVVAHRGDGFWVADYLQRAKASPSLWQPDR